MTTVALLQFLAEATSTLSLNKETKRNAADHTYIVGGAVRNFLLGIPPKDIDVVVDSIGLGEGSDWLALQLQQLIPARTSLTTNQYGVAILTITSAWDLDGGDLKGEVIEIATARKESYGGPGGKGYKPHMVEPATIKEDVYRREFTVNTLLWRLSDIAERGVEGAHVLDLTNHGLDDLGERVLATPRDPLTTFTDDPTRMLRAIKFMVKYEFALEKEECLAIKRCGQALKQMPWDAVRKILVDDILKTPGASRGLSLLVSLNLSPILRDMLAEEKGFASALSRETKNLDLLLAMELVLEENWPIKHPLSMLAEEEQLVVYHRLLECNNNDAADALIEAIIKPPIDQPQVFQKCGLEGPDRAKVTQTARNLLVDWPLGAGFEDLQEKVERLLGG